MSVPTRHVAEQHVQRWLVRAVGLLWVAQLGPWAVVAWSQEWASAVTATVIVGSYVAYCCWGVAVFGVVLRRRSPGTRLLGAMVAVMLVCVLVVGLACRPGSVVSWQNWTPAPATGVGMLAQALGGWRWGAGSVTALGGTWALTALRDLPVAPGNVVPLVGNIGQLVAFTVVGGLVFARLLGAARTADAALADALAARGAEARLQERMRQYEMLHTNVLTTLTLIARGDGAVGADLRARCAREVNHLRTLVRSTVHGNPPGLATALAEVVLAQSALGLRIHHHSDGLPVDLPAEVVEALAQAVTEALNNAAKHAGVDEVWVTAVGCDDQAGGVRVSVTDRGRGFDVAAAPRGVGLARTLGCQVQDVGGTVTVRSWPGEGTSVEMTWSR